MAKLTLGECRLVACCVCICRCTSIIAALCVFFVICQNYNSGAKRRIRGDDALTVFVKCCFLSQRAFAGLLTAFRKFILQKVLSKPCTNTIYYGILYIVIYLYIIFARSFADIARANGKQKSKFLKGE